MLLALLAAPGSSSKLAPDGNSVDNCPTSNVAGSAWSQFTGIGSAVSGVTTVSGRVSSILAFVSVNRTLAAPTIIGT